MFTKKRVGLFIFILSFLLLINFVCAVDSIDNEGNPIIGGGDPKTDVDYTENVIKVTNGITKLADFFLSPLFGDTELLSRVFMALLLGMIVYSIISGMFKNTSKPVKLVISFAITALALLGLPSGFLEAIRTQYAAMGAAILVMIPFIIVFIFSLSIDSLFICRVTWVFYSLYYLAMYLYLILTTETGWFSSSSIPYFAGFLAGIAVFFVIPGVRDLMWAGDLNSMKEKGIRNVKKRGLLLDLEMKRLEDTGTK